MNFEQQNYAATVNKKQLLQSLYIGANSTQNVKPHGIEMLMLETIYSTLVSDNCLVKKFIISKNNNCIDFVISIYYSIMISIKNCLSLEAILAYHVAYYYAFNLNC